MAIHYSIEIICGNSSVTSDDRSRAEAAIEAAFASEGIDTDEQYKNMLDAYLASIESEPHDAALAAAFDRIQSAGDIALTEGWHDPNGAGLSLGIR